MPPLSHSAKTVLANLDFSPRKSRGQNFLINQRSAASIVRFAELKQGDRVLEIGPGLGKLTEELMQLGTALQLVEIEPRFCTHLEQSFPALAGQIICRDIRSLRLSELSLAYGEKIVVIGNIPYSISSDLIMWTFRERYAIRRAVFLLQREFAERIAAGPGSKRYGSLSVWRELYADASLGPTLSGASFYPAAKVDSRLLVMRFLNSPRYALSSEEVFEKVLRAAFGTRRKMLINSLLHAGLFLEKNSAQAALAQLALAPSSRAEQLSTQQFVLLANYLHSHSLTAES